MRAGGGVFGARQPFAAALPSSESYNCYKIIAKDLGLEKPWEEPGKEEPDSLVEQQRIVRKRVQDSLREGT